MKKQVFLTEDQKISFASFMQRNDTIFNALQKHYPHLQFHIIGDQGIVETEGLTEAQKMELILDLEFLCRNPHLPLENIHAHLSNYIPTHPSQVELLKYAHTLGNMGQNAKAGLFIYGPPGVGKTHIVVGIAKDSLRRNKNPLYMNLQPRYASSYRSVADQDLSPHFTIEEGIWILDDLNTPYGSAMKIFKTLVLNTHDYGGLLLVTSNLSFDFLMENGFATDPNEKIRFIDRARNIFAILEVKGDSQRAKTAWHSNNSSS